MAAIWSNEVTIQNPTTTVSVDNFPATQPVSGTVSVDNFPATQPVSGSVSVSGSVNVGNFPATQPVSGTIAVSNFPGASVGTATVSNISVGAGAAVTLATSNVNRRKLIIHNETGTLHVKLGTSASASSYSYRLTANTVLEITQYYGDVTAIKASGTTPVLVTDL